MNRTLLAISALLALTIVALCRADSPKRDLAAPEDRECVISNGVTDAPCGARAMRKPDEAIVIRAKPPAKDMRFDQWVGNVEFLKDPKAAETTLTMPPAGYAFGHVHVSAAYRSTQKLPFLHPMFRDHMVLQRDVAAPVWGWTTPGEKVTIRIAGVTSTATAGADGRWLAKVGPLKAGGPYELTISGSQSVAIKDVLVGDVWLCSGQSNMRGQGVPAEDAATANYPQIRYLNLNPSAESYDGAEPFQTFEGYKADWQLCTPAAAKSFSRVAYFFGEALHRQHGVPIGLVVCSYDGSCIEAWMPKPTLASLPELTMPDGGFRPNWNLSWGGGGTPFIRYNSHIAPLAPFAFRGVLWYQGESNANNLKSIRYRDLLTLMIRDWRKLFGNEQLPFVLIQLHGFGKLDTARPPGSRRETWVELQESQLAVARSVPHVACAVTVDLAKEQSLHPPDKKTIARRAALAARHVAYGEDVPAYGPLFKAITVDGESIRISFEHAEGLRSRDGQPLRYFAVAGDDHKFEWAEAKIVGDAVVVSSAKVKKPIAVRYAWGSAQQESNLSNASGLPAPAFRSDAWEESK
jgi:sialate O-acetylesterase